MASLQTDQPVQITEVNVKETYDKIIQHHKDGNSLPPKMKLGDEVQFTQLNKCSDGFQKSFKQAWKAIRLRNPQKLRDAITEMETQARNCATLKAQGNKAFLNVCYLQPPVVSHFKGAPALYFMTLLSYAAVQKKMELVEILLKNKADPNAGNGLSGTALTQLLVYALHHNKPEVVDIDIVSDLIQRSQVADLNVNIYYHIPNRYHSDNEAKVWSYCSPIELALKLQNLDVAKRLVEAGANPITLDEKPGENTSIIPVLDEYYDFGKNDFLHWLLHEFWTSEEISSKIEEMMSVKIFNERVMEKFREVGRHPADAFLTCGHEGIVKALRKCPRHAEHVTDERIGEAMKTAASKGDLDSLEILLQIGKESNCIQPEDMGEYLLAAAQDGHKRVVQFIHQQDSSVITSEIMKEAIEEGLSSIFEVVRDSDPKRILDKDDEDDTLAHRAARVGNTELFKVTFPLVTLASDVPGTESDSNEGMFASLVQKNKKRLTPLHVAIEKDQICILKTLQERIKERDSKPSAAQKKEKDMWDKMWKQSGPQLLCYACTKGSVDAVKFLVGTMDCPLSDESYESPKGTPLQCAAKAGKDETVKYLLEFKKEPDYDMEISLALAAKHGHNRCVRKLLKSGANVSYEDEGGYNCLMLAIQEKHKDTVLTIVSDKDQGLDALRHYNGSTTPMAMLIENKLQDEARWVLNKCELSVGISRNSDADDSDLWELKDQFELLESPEKAVVHYQDEEEIEMPTISETTGTHLRPRNVDNGCMHPLQLMVKFHKEDAHEEKLLFHPLIKKLVKRKLKLITPLVSIGIGIYISYLVLLTTFVFLLPLPGSQSNVCNYLYNNTTVTAYVASNSSCNDIGSKAPPAIYFFLAVVIVVFNLLFIVYEGLQLARKQKQYIKDRENYIQLLSYLICIVFAFPAGQSDCWCYPSWKWQIGALSLFLSWLIFILHLKHATSWNIGQNITMLFNVYWNFIKIFYLPFLLILTFGIPFYMLLVHSDEAAFEEGSDPGILYYINPEKTFFKVILQTVGDLDANAIFINSPLPHPHMAYLLFIVFIIAMPVLFNNFLIGVAVGQTEDQLKKASLELMKAKIDNIFEFGGAYSFLIKCLCIKQQSTCCRHSNCRLGRATSILNEHERKQLEQENTNLLNAIKKESQNIDMKQSVVNISKEIDQLQQRIESDHQHLKDLKGELSAWRKELAQAQ